MARLYRNSGKMFLLIAQWEESGMTQVEFCHTRNIPKSTFYYWHKKYKEEKEGCQNSFIPVTVKESVPSSCSEPEITITYPNQVQVTLSKGSSVEYIRELIHIF